jgi:hypothetical protein
VVGISTDGLLSTKESRQQQQGASGRDPTYRCSQYSVGERRGWRQDPIVDTVEDNQICLSR